MKTEGQLVYDNYLIFTALTEEGDITVLDGQGKIVSYSEFKSITGNLKLTFPVKDFSRENSEFQINVFHKNNTKLFFMRTMISGRSVVKEPSGNNIYRPLPIFEVYILDRSMIENLQNETSFLDLFKSLNYKHYPEMLENTEGQPYIQKPVSWFVPDTLKSYASIINKKSKSWAKLNDVKDWNLECQKRIVKLLWFLWKNRRVMSGKSLCFDQDEFNRYDVCHYLSDRNNRSILKYKLFKYDSR
jgi:hypothetical protein